MEPFKMNEWQMGGSPSSATATGSEDAAPPGFRNVRKEDVTTPMKKKTHITMTGLCKPPFDFDLKLQLPTSPFLISASIRHSDREVSKNRDRDALRTRRRNMCG